MQNNSSIPELSDYPELIRNGINLPRILIQHAIQYGWIHPADPIKTKPRCPLGKKAAELQRRLQLHPHTSPPTSPTPTLPKP